MGTEWEDTVQKGKDWEKGQKGCPCLQMMRKLWEIFHLTYLGRLVGRKRSTSAHAWVCAVGHPKAVRTDAFTVSESLLTSSHQVKVKAPTLGCCNLHWLHWYLLLNCRACLHNQLRCWCLYDIHLCSVKQIPPFSASCSHTEQQDKARGIKETGQKQKYTLLSKKWKSNNWMYSNQRHEGAQEAKSNLRKKAHMKPWVCCSKLEQNSLTHCSEGLETWC